MRIFSGLLLELTAAICVGETELVDTNCTYLRTNDDAGGRHTQFLRLPSRMTPGTWVYIRSTGEFVIGIQGQKKTGLYGCFTETTDIRASNVQNRLVTPLPRPSGTSAVTSDPTFVGDLPTNISQDFWVPRDGQWIQIPSGARYITFSPDDNMFQDNTDTDKDFKFWIDTNSPPNITGPGPISISEFQFAEAMISATDPYPASAVNLNLTGNTFGASFDPSSGRFVFQPGESLGGLSLNFIFQATDSGLPVLSSTLVLTVHIAEVNSPPQLTGIADRVVNEEDQLLIPLSASDPDIPANNLTYSLVNAPVGMQINPSSGLINWVPTEAQGPGTYTVTTRVTDNGSPNLSDEKTFSVRVEEVNRKPDLDQIPDRTVLANTLFTATASATDPDIPQNSLSYDLVDAPPDMNIDPITGAISWQPRNKDVGSHTIVYRVKDSGNPPLSVSKSFTIFVRKSKVQFDGAVNLLDFKGSPDSVSATVTIRKPGEATILFEQVIQLSGESKFNISAEGLDPGLYDISCKPSHWLERKLNSVSLTIEGHPKLDFMTLNGDCNGDDIITTDDYLILNASFDKSVEDTGFDPRADLDGDGTVTTDDYLILNKNWDLEGD